MIDLALQSASQDIWQSKYCLKKENGIPVDRNIEDTYKRVATALSNVEISSELKIVNYKKFLWALQNGAIPAGRIIANAGSSKYKPSTSTINCTVSSTISDSMDDILKKIYEAGMTLKSGCGIGYDFSTLRPRGAFVSGAGSHTSGPISFMDIFDKMCFTIASAGGRRGAQMGVFDIRHPDIFDFIEAKRENGRLRQFNLSLLITDEFIEAVTDDLEWKLSFPITEFERKVRKIDLNDKNSILWRDWPIKKPYIVNDLGLVACRVYKVVRAKELWNKIMSLTYNYAEPGFILIDKVNRENNNWFCESIRATNPCGEQPLPPYGSCLLGSINLTSFINSPFTDRASFDWSKYCKVVRIFTRMLDNVVELNRLPLKQQSNEIISKRRHGMGFLGLGSALAMLKKRYGSESSIDFTRNIVKNMALEGWREGISLAKEKGSAPIFEQEHVITENLLRLRPEMLRDGIKLGDKVKGRILHAKYSYYMQKIFKEDASIIKDICNYGCRFTHHTSIAPSGTISLSLANNSSNGIEPSFAHQYSRNIIREGKKTKEKVDVFSYELLVYRHLVKSGAIPSPDNIKNLPKYFSSSNSVTPEEHIDIQSAAQEWIDSSISKTINIPTNFPFKKFKDIYLQAYRKNLKGCTTFRFNPEAFQGILVRKEDLKNTTYFFDLDDKSSVQCKGDDIIEYDGEKHTAANLYDALKEGYYGKF